LPGNLQLGRAGAVAQPNFYNQRSKVLSLHRSAALRRLMDGAEIQRSEGATSGPKSRGWEHAGTSPQQTFLDMNENLKVRKRVFWTSTKVFESKIDFFGGCGKFSGPPQSFLEADESWQVRNRLVWT
jgi:hypothetical protein